MGKIAVGEGENNVEKSEFVWYNGTVQTNVCNVIH